MKHNNMISNSKPPSL